MIYHSLVSRDLWLATLYIYSPKSPPDVETHDIQPEERRQEQIQNSIA